MNVQSFVTSWGSQISPYIQKQVIKRLKNEDSIDVIIEQEIADLLDRHAEKTDEAYEIVWHCVEIFQKNSNVAVE
jgi:hypothetical protein